MDEYSEFEGNYVLTTTDRNCYSIGIQSTQEDCLQNAQWKDYIGDGCGEDGVVDCEQNNDEFYDLEINCFESCKRYPSSIYRSSFNTIMRYHRSNIYSFGLWNQMLIEGELDKFSGE